MLPSIESLTTATLSLALDAATLRQQAIAANIANAGVEGYERLGVAFEEQLAQARDSLQRRGTVALSDLQQVELGLAPLAREQGGGPGVQLDVEVAEMARDRDLAVRVVPQVHRMLAVP